MTAPPHISRRRYQRQLRLEKLGYRGYREYLRSPHWSQVRAAYAASPVHPQDCICGETERLQLHHLTYEHIGAEDLADLTPLCSTCHAMIHTLEARGEMGLDFSGLVNEKRAERRRKELEAAAYEREMDRLWNIAFTEDIRREFRKIGGPSFRYTRHRICQELKKLEAKFEALP